MKYILVILLAFALMSCTDMPIKLRPEYKDVDPRVEPLVKEYLSLAKQSHITFYNKVTIGFKKIKQDSVVGICTYGPTWREIDLDIDYWNNSTPSERLMVVYHELTHCYCDRNHDYAENKPYGTLEEQVREFFLWEKRGGPKPGRYDSDSCPTSLMYPFVLGRECLLAHYSDYVKEMFDRCEPF